MDHTVSDRMSSFHQPVHAMRFAVTLLVTATLVACGSSSDPDIQSSRAGIIVARDVPISIGDPPTIHVKGDPNEQCGVIYLITPTTSIVRRAVSGKIRLAKVSELTVGSRVDVRAGIVAQSCPGQSWAEVVQIIDVS
jgi:hypothetical protein